MLATLHIKFQVVFTISSLVGNPVHEVSGRLTVSFLVGNPVHEVSGRLQGLISCWQPCTWSFRSSLRSHLLFHPCTWSFRSSLLSHLMLATLYMEFQVVFTISSIFGNPVHGVTGRLYGFISCWQPCKWSFRSSLQSHLLLATLYMEFQVVKRSHLL